MIARTTWSTSTAPASWDEKYRTQPAAVRDPAGYAQQAFVRTVLQYLSVGQRVLDAGCGTGGLTKFLHQRGMRVAGIDASEAAIAIARHETPGGEFAVADIDALPFGDTSFDAYLAIGSWEYLANGPSRAAAEARRVLALGGFAMIEVPIVNTLRRIFYLPLKKLRDILGVLGGKRPRFAHYLFTREELRGVLTTHGFEILDIQPHDLPEPPRHFGLWVDWPFLRGRADYELNPLGRCLKAVGNAISPWTISTGMFIVARKQ